MQLNVYAIKDTAVGRFSSTPFMLENDEVAKRTFGTAINSGSQSQVAVYYKDMQLWRLGSFEDRTGELTSDVEFVCSGVDVKEVKTKGDDANGIQERVEQTDHA